MVLANLQAFICNFIYEPTGYKNSKLTLLPALYSQECNFPCKLLYSTLLNTARFSRGKKPSPWQRSFVIEVLCNLCLQATCLCRGRRKKSTIQKTQIPQQEQSLPSYVSSQYHKHFNQQKA